MGCSGSKDDENDYYNHQQQYRQGPVQHYAGNHPQGMSTVMTLVSQANQMAAPAVAQPLQLAGNSAMDVEWKIRRAKNEGRTVKIEDCQLYIDYQFMGYIPPHWDLDTY